MDKYLCRWKFPDLRSFPDTGYIAQLVVSCQGAQELELGGNQFHPFVYCHGILKLDLITFVVRKTICLL